MVQIEQNHEGLPGLGPIKKNKTSSEETGIDDSQEKNSYDGELSDSSNEALNNMGRLTVGAPGFGGVVPSAEEELGITKEEIERRSDKDKAMIDMI